MHISSRWHLAESYKLHLTILTALSNGKKVL